MQDIENEADESRADLPGRRWSLSAYEGDRSIEMMNQGVLDEVKIDDWLHLEQMDTRLWWMRVGDTRLWIRIGQDGSTQVDVERGCYASVNGETVVIPDPDASR